MPRGGFVRWGAVAPGDTLPTRQGGFLALCWAGRSLHQPLFLGGALKLLEHIRAEVFPDEHILIEQSKAANLTPLRRLGVQAYRPGRMSAATPSPRTTPPCSGISRSCSWKWATAIPRCCVPATWFPPAARMPRASGKVPDCPGAQKHTCKGRMEPRPDKRTA